MRELSTTEQQFVSGAAVTMETWATMDQVLSNVLDGMSTGMSLGGYWAAVADLLSAQFPN
ncbi:hypothetical protein HA41_05525 [Pantoea conspicua]|uniref:Uncharacterized protein n=1 Tax=Pantoea conspicua TaxID=472705 RepID=A0A1X1BZI4_9GAMM|nr:hypothetical protein [Pantoea conspicua]ORM54448.1 hypothetical protein HA41_05525 [Pantoea conspicua]